MSLPRLCHLGKRKHFFFEETLYKHGCFGQLKGTLGHFSVCGGVIRNSGVVAKWKKIIRPLRAFKRGGGGQPFGRNEPWRRGPQRFRGLRYPLKHQQICERCAPARVRSIFVYSLIKYQGFFWHFLANQLNLSWRFLSCSGILLEFFQDFAFVPMILFEYFLTF